MLNMAIRKTVFVLGGAWLMLGLAYVVYVASSQRASIEETLQRESTNLHRIVSQRADQHAAHLTSLSALAVAGEHPQKDSFLQVAAAIRQFYPRITAVDLVPLAAKKQMLTTRNGVANLASIKSVIRDSVARSAGELMLTLSPAAAGRYLIVKRSPNNELARFGLAVEIDALALVESDAPFWQKTNAFITLALPDGTVLIDEQTRSSLADDKLTPALTTDSTLGSQTQPLLLTTHFLPRLSDILPATRIFIGLASIGFALLAAAFLLRLVARTRSAELRARLGEQGARIAHASRINALGEMASGMAHELTQPLTAILSQSQAGARLIARDEMDRAAIAAILQDNVAQSKRAAGILTRLREWSKVSPSAPTPQSVNECIANVAFLLGPETRRLQIDLQVQAAPVDTKVIGDAVEIEQLIFNLVRNAIDAVESETGKQRRINISNEVNHEHVVVEVTDNGPGIAAAMRERLFEPFATGKKDGMGLGLALCERIVERMQGRLEIGAATGGGVTARVILPLA